MEKEESAEIQKIIGEIDKTKDKLPELQMDSLVANKELGQTILELHDVIDELIKLFIKSM